MANNHRCFTINFRHFTMVNGYETSKKNAFGTLPAVCTAALTRDALGASSELWDCSLRQVKVRSWLADCLSVPGLQNLSKSYQITPYFFVYVPLRIHSPQCFLPNWRQLSVKRLVSMVRVSDCGRTAFSNFIYFFFNSMSFDARKMCWEVREIEQYQII